MYVVCSAVSNDPYVMEETCARSSRALGSSLWEVWALRRHPAPALAAAAATVLQPATDRAAPLALTAPDLAAVTTLHASITLTLSSIPPDHICVT